MPRPSLPRRSRGWRLAPALPAAWSLLFLCVSCRADPLPGAQQAGPLGASPQQSVTTAPAPPPLLHWPVAAPAPLHAADPVLLVGLAARLGPAPDTKAAVAAPLELVAASGTLTLIDAEGQGLQAPRLTLHWHRQPLPAPMEIRRRVIAPLASFESAEEVARSWRSQGVEVAIARAADWEVWAPPEAGDPPGRTSRLLERRETSRLVLELRQQGGKRIRLSGPIRLQAPGGLVWRQGLYSGPFLLQPDAQGTWSLVEQVPLERYLEGVVPHEIGAGSPPAALTAQAVLARTWALRNRHRFRVDGYHLCADTQCQVYSDPRQAGSAVRQAIAASRLQVLASGGEPIHAVYHATNGGVAAGFEEVWQGAALPYLRAFPDGPPAFTAAHPLPLSTTSLPSLLRGGAPSGWGAYHPLYRWQRTLTAGGLSTALGNGAAAVGTPTGVRVLQRGPSGRVLALEIRGTAGKRVLRLDAIRRTLRQLPSTLFTVAPSGPGRWLVQGGGFGHGAGLSQAGAIDLAGRGWSSTRILQHYYPGTTLVPLRSLGEAL